MIRKNLPNWEAGGFSTPAPIPPVCGGHLVGIYSNDVFLESTIQFPVEI